MLVICYNKVTPIVQAVNQLKADAEFWLGKI